VFNLDDVRSPIRKDCGRSWYEQVASNFPARTPDNMSYIRVSPTSYLVIALDSY